MNKFDLAVIYLRLSNHICGICHKFNQMNAFILHQGRFTILVSNGEEYYRCSPLKERTLSDNSTWFKENPDFCPKLENYLLKHGEENWNFSTIWEKLSDRPFPENFPNLWRLVFGLWLYHDTQRGLIDNLELFDFMDLIEEEDSGMRVTYYFAEPYEDPNARVDDEEFFIGGNRLGLNLSPTSGQLMEEEGSLFEQIPNTFMINERNAF